MSQERPYPQFIPVDADGNILGSFGGGSGSGSGSTATTNTSDPPVTRVTSYTYAVGTGTIPSGTNSAAIANVGNAAGTIKNQSFPAGASVSWSANGKDTLDAIGYDATGTEFAITTVI